MKSSLFRSLLFIAILFSSMFSNAENKKRIQNQIKTYEGSVVSDKGAWCWFADPRALHYQNAAGTINSTYIGYIDVHGNIKATQQNFLTGKTNEVLIRSYFQPDDHNNPSFLVLPDERVMIFYTRHTDEACFYYRISKKPGDITTLGDEKKLLTPNNTTYPSPFILSDDPTHIYLCWRGLKWHPTIARLTMPDASDNVTFNWGPYQMVQSTAARPYCKFYSNGKDKINLAYTTGHPDNEYPNWLYYSYVDINSKQLKDINGTVQSTIAVAPHNVNRTNYNTQFPNAVVDMPTNQRNWVWQTTIDTDGKPVVAMVQISNDKLTHNYYYAKWTGSSWRKTFLANGGGKFHQTANLEMCYSGGMAIDDSNPNIVYCSVPIDGANGKVYEIYKYTLDSEGRISSTEAITSNSKLNNVRPYIVHNAGTSALKLLWMHGNYYDWIVSSVRPQGYPTAIHSNYALPLDNIDLNNGQLINEGFNGSIAGTAFTTEGVAVLKPETRVDFQVQISNSFSISLTPYIYEGAYSGQILKSGNISYGLNGSTLKPYITIGSTTYDSNNVLGTSDVWKTQTRGTNGSWPTPTKHKYFNLTLTYENGILRIYRNGLIDQVIEAQNLSLNNLQIGGFDGLVEDCRIYNRALTQSEVKELTKISLAYTLNANLITEIEMQSITVPTSVYTDVLLPSKTQSGNSVLWTSSNTTVMSNTGLVNLPSAETTIELTAQIGAKTKKINITVHPRDITKNKVFEYRFESNDVQIINGASYIQDKSGNNNNARIFGSTNVNGKLDMTANTGNGFATNTFAMAPEGILSNVRSYSLLAKIKPVNLNQQPRIFDFGSASSNSVLLRAKVFSAGFKYNGGTTSLINSSTSIPEGQESLIAMTFDAKTKTTKLYLNAQETASASTIIYEPHQLVSIAANTRNYIGRTQWWDSSVSADNHDFVGTIDDVFMFDISLTPSEIITIQNSSNTSLNKLDYDELSVYPNPISAGSDLNIKLTNNVGVNNISEIEIMNIFGQSIKKIQTSSFPITTKMTYAKGIYFIKLKHNNNQTLTKKIIIN